MELVEKSQKEQAELTTQLDAEKTKLETMRKGIGDKVASIQKEIDELQVPRAQTWSAVPAKARELFDKLAERHEGEALSALSKPDRRREEYVCTACNMELVPDVYNKLHSRDELVFCPSCRRILYIPEDLPPEAAVHKKKPTKPKKGPDIGAAPRSQESAVDVMNSITPEESEAPAEPTETSESSQ
jgi:hypothetical protein